MRHLLRRPDGAHLLVDSDLWIAVLDLAVLHGWRPRGTRDPDAALCRASEHEMAWEPLSYFLPRGQSIEAADARALASSCARGLSLVPEREVPLGGADFGEAHTLSLLRLAAASDELPPDGSRAAVEILSGAPKKEAESLLRFLKDGHVTIRPEVEPA